MSKKIKQFTTDIESLDIDQEVKAMLLGGISDLNDEFKTEITRTKTKLNDAFEGEKLTWQEQFEELKKAQKPESKQEPNKDILDQIEILKRELSNERELRESAEKERVETKIKAKLMKGFEGSIDAELLADKHLNMFKIVDGELFTNDSDLTPVNEFIDNLKVQKAAWWGAKGNGGNGNNGQKPSTPNDIFSMAEIEGMSESYVKANMEKVDRSLAYHSKNS